VRRRHIAVCLAAPGGCVDRQREGGAEIDPGFIAFQQQFPVTHRVTSVASTQGKPGQVFTLDREALKRDGTTAARYDGLP